jgi:mRNA interferase MazF
MRRGEVWWIDFNPSVGGEIRKKRPAVIVSNDLANRYLNRLQVVPLSTKTDKLYPCEALVDFNGIRSNAMADQLTTVSKNRRLSRGGELSSQEMESIERIVKLQLDLH